MIGGGCLCGTVRFELDPSGILLFNTCYCTRCRKQTGTGFTAQLQVSAERFRWLEGADHIAAYESSPGVTRTFCRVCGSRTPSPHGTLDMVAVPAGALDDDPGVVPEINMHIASRAHWAPIDARLTSIEGQGSESFWHGYMANRHDSS